MKKGITTKRSLIALAGAPLLLPVIAHAQSKTLADLITKIVGYIEQALFLIMAIAVLIFIVQVIRYFVLPNENRKEAGLYVMYSVIGFFVIFSLWGLVNILSGTFGIDTNKPQSWEAFTNIFPR